MLTYETNTHWYFWIMTRPEFRFRTGSGEIGPVQVDLAGTRPVRYRNLKKNSCWIIEV